MTENTSKISIFGRTVSLPVIACLLIALSLISYWPYVSTGFCADDFLFLSMLEGAISYDPIPGFWYGDIDSYPVFSNLWWKEPGVEGAFLRPLASWTLTLLYKIFGRNAVGYHIVLLILHGLGAFTFFLILRRLSGQDLLPLLAALLFLICEDHGMTVTWITTITDLMCFLFLNLAFLCHITARPTHNYRLFALSLVLSLAAFASKETGAIYPMIIIAYEFCFADSPIGDNGYIKIGERVRLFFKKWKAWLIPLVIIAAYLLFYRSIIPPMKNLMYVDPFDHPGQYAVKMLTNLPVMFLGLLTQFLPSLVLLLPGTLTFAVVAGTAITGLLIWALTPYRGENTVWFSLVVFLLTLLPGLATEPGERLLYIPSAYGMLVVSWLITQTPQLGRFFPLIQKRGVPILGSIWGFYLILSAVVVPVILLFVYPSTWIPGMKIPERTVLRSLPHITEDYDGDVIYLNTNSSFNTFYLSDIYRYHRGEYVDIYVLSSFNGHVWARQDSEDTIALKVKKDGWLSNMFARIVRVTSTFSKGQVYTNRLFTATVIDVMPGDTDVQEVCFEFKDPLHDPSLLFLYYDGKSYRPWTFSMDWELLNMKIESYSF
jgi:hypothetical protein